MREKKEGWMTKKQTRRRRGAHEKKIRALREQLLLIDGGLCHWCKVEMEPPGAGAKCLTVDHVVRVADGGATEIGNVVLACRDCNQRRGYEAERRERTPELLTEWQLVELLY
jgi:5-methylcytosine-specific restriction endonuclease McrA